MDNTELETAFLNTNYIILKNDVFLEDIVLKIGEVHDFSSTLHNLKEWVFITAWNPLPDILSKDQNEKRNAALLDQLKADGFKSHFGQGVSADGEWFEDSFFIENLSKDKALFYASKFGQVAFVHCSANEKAELVFT